MTTPSRIETGLDRRTHAFRPDLAASELIGIVEAPRYVEGLAARVAFAVAPLRKEPDHRAMLETEALYGERLRVLDRARGWAWVQLDADRYVGYMPEEAISESLFAATHRVQALATFIYPVADIKAPPLLTLPMEAAVVVANEGARFAELGTGGFVVSRHLRPLSRPALDFVDVAERFIGVPYLWGGKTRVGLDCSGLLQVAMAAAGLAAPRDSDMQEKMLGENVLVPESCDGLERGDLVFWPGHAGVMVDGVMLLHANAHHMAVAVEPLKTAADRIQQTGSRISAVKRLTALGSPRAV